MRKIYLFLAFCLMSMMHLHAEKDYVAIISPYPDETVLTLYYVDNPQEFCKGVNEWHWIGEDFTWFFNGPGPLSQYGDPFLAQKDQPGGKQTLRSWYWMVELEAYDQSQG